MERMSDERLAEIERELPPWRTQPRYAFAKELLQALKAEREYVNEREEGWRDHVTDLHDKILTLEAQLETVRAEVERLQHLCRTEFDELTDSDYSEWVDVAGKARLAELAELSDKQRRLLDEWEDKLNSAEAVEAKLAAVRELPRYSTNEIITEYGDDPSVMWISEYELDAALSAGNTEPPKRPIHSGYQEKDTLTGEVREPLLERDWTSDPWQKR